MLADVGDEPFELRYHVEGLATEQQVRQRVHASGGTLTHFSVDTYEFHPTHAHFQDKNFG
jgi:hypothetical protein